eukprot:130783-Rhodomonas_salina.1
MGKVSFDARPCREQEHCRASGTAERGGRAADQGRGQLEIACRVFDSALCRIFEGQNSRGIGPEPRPEAMESEAEPPEEEATDERREVELEGPGDLNALTAWWSANVRDETLHPETKSSARASRGVCAPGTTSLRQYRVFVLQSRRTIGQPAASVLDLAVPRTRRGTGHATMMRYTTSSSACSQDSLSQFLTSPRILPTTTFRLLPPEPRVADRSAGPNVSTGHSSAKTERTGHCEITDTSTPVRSRSCCAPGTDSAPTMVPRHSSNFAAPPITVSATGHGREHLSRSDTLKQKRRRTARGKGTLCLGSRDGCSCRPLSQSSVAHVRPGHRAANARGGE